MASVGTTAVGNTREVDSTGKDGVTGSDGRRLRHATVMLASKTFTLLRRPFQGFPIVRSGNGTVIEPIADYLRERALYKNYAVGSLQDEAYALCEWWNFLEARGIVWTQANDRSLLLWTQEQLARSVSQARITRKIHIVHTFYRTLQCTLHQIDKIIEDGSDPNRRWQINADVVITVDRTGQKHMAFRPRIRFSTVPKAVKGRRPTPSPDEVIKVLDQLADRDREYLGARDWLCASWMARVGLRRAGVASLTVQSLEHALQLEGMWDSKSNRLEALATDTLGRLRLHERLQAYAEGGRENLFITVTEKGDKTRTTPVPIDFFLQNLEYVWDLRAAFVGRLPSQARHHGRALWLSMKGGRALSAKSIGDLVKNAFNTAGVAGSGHRLRASYATQLFLRRTLEAKSVFGDLWDPRIVLEEVAEVLGHERPETLRPYLNAALRMLSASAVQRHAQIDPIDASVFHRIVQRIESGDKRLAADLLMFLNAREQWRGQGA